MKLLDRFNRKIEYARISVTDRCNLRCKYCMPEHGVKKLSHDEILTYEEILQVTKIFARLGIKKIRLTGGEPLLRKNISALIYSLKQIAGIEKVALTTNGVLLKNQAKNLRAAGLDGVNLSLDTLDEKIFAKLTRRNLFAEVQESLQILLDENFADVKINCVPLRGINENEILNLVELTKNNPIKLRFIELMPIGCAKISELEGIPTAEIFEKIKNKFGDLIQLQKNNSLCGPAEYFSIKNFRGEIGFIDALEHKFCSSCNRVRLTAEGFFKPCLNFGAGLDVKKLLRSNVSDEIIFSEIERTIFNKPQEHFFNVTQNKNFDKRKMYQIGG